MYGCESWTIKSADSKRLNAFEMDMYRRMMGISWREHRTNNSIIEEMQPTCRFLAEVNQTKEVTVLRPCTVVWADNLCTHILHGTIAGNRRRGRPQRRWTDDIKQWTGIPVADCVQRAREKRLEILGVRVGDLRSSDMRKDLGKARQGIGDIPRVLYQPPIFYHQRILT